MGAKVQSKTFFPGSMMDISNGAWPGNSQHYDYFLTTQATDGCTKDQIRQTILKHESIFKHQLQELHRLYKRQRDLMNPVPTETLKSDHFLSQLSSDVSKETHIFGSSFPLIDSTFNPLDSIKAKSTLGVSGRRVIDLELPADVDESKIGKSQISSIKKGFNLADLNEPIQVDEMAFSASVSNKNHIDHLTEELQKRNSSTKRMLFGVEICNGTHTPTFHSSNHQFRTGNSESTFVLPWTNAAYSSQYPASFNHNRWIGSFAGHSRSMTNSVPANLEETYARKKHTFLNMWKNREIPEHIPKGTTGHHINLDSLQNHSQQFFKKADVTEGTHEFKNIKLDETQSVTKILGVPIIEKKAESNIRHHIDLNLSLDEEDASGVQPSFPESVVKIATMEIDLEAPAVLEPDLDNDDMDADVELVKVAAEVIVSISSSELLEPSVDTLLWFADMITSNEFEKISDESVPDGMDYFEYMTLKLQETDENYDRYTLTIVEEKEYEGATSAKRTPRKGQGKRGRQRKDFQKDVLPSIVSLSRREVTEDLQIFEEAFSATGVFWQSSFSKRKSAGRNGRGRRRLVAANPSSSPPPPPPPPLEQDICREFSLEKNLGGWGRRTRRLPRRQRCQTSGNHHHSFALKC